jgi:hypothetical protein
MTREEGTYNKEWWDVWNTPPGYVMIVDGEYQEYR